MVQVLREQQTRAILSEKSHTSALLWSVAEWSYTVAEIFRRYFPEDQAAQQKLKFCLGNSPTYLKMFFICNYSFNDRCVIIHGNKDVKSVTQAMNFIQGSGSSENPDLPNAASRQTGIERKWLRHPVR